MASPELVVLVDEQNNQIGTMPKAEVHSANTPLHRGFSSFIFNSRGEILLQQRAHSKKTWPLVWSNSCCGHPGPDETNIDAAHRRLSYELGLTSIELTEISPYRYQFVRDGVMENEICPIIVGMTDQTPTPNPDEVEAIRWMSWNDFVADTRIHPENWSEWCVEEVELMTHNQPFRDLWNKTWNLPTM